MQIKTLGKDDIPFNENSAITVGTFDGVHCGHRGIIRRMKEVATPVEARTVVVTFDPHPQIVLHKEDRPHVELLSTIEERCDALESVGVDMVVVIPFTLEFAATPPEDFIRNVIVETIGVRHFFIGHDHNFGRDREGNEALLSSLGQEIGFSVERIGPLTCNDLVVSSTKIRKALQSGDVATAATMLDTPYVLTGTIIQGDGRGRQLGFPTANVDVDDKHKLMPGKGVYVVSLTTDNNTYAGMANIGVRPTFKDDNKIVLEVNLVDTTLDLYGKTVRIEFHTFLRGELRFASKEALLEQLERDKQETLNTYFTTVQPRRDP